MVNMLKKIGLKTRLFLLIWCLVIILAAGGIWSVRLVRTMADSFAGVLDMNVGALNVAQELESSLAMQRGLLTYYFVDGDAEWLTQLDQQRYAFERWLKKAREASHSDEQLEILNEIESKYIRYSHARDQVITLYKSGSREAGLQLLREIRSPFFAIRDLCEQYKQTHYRDISTVRETFLRRAQTFVVLVLLFLPLSLLILSALGYLLVTRFFRPILQLSEQVKTNGDSIQEADEVGELSRRVHNLIEDADVAQIQLRQSREHLLQTEKLAMVGKLAAGVAHSIRNPLTSVKMRLFTMERTLKLSSTQKEDFDVISDEIRHIDTIVQNFLEFSRPPKLKMQTISPSDVVDMAIQLLRHRVESYGVTLELIRQRRLPVIEADPEQLKEVFVNLIVNACEATGDGGKILIREEEGVAEPLGHVAVIRLSDNGPGIPEVLREKVFQPFFSTKEEGTGLGLSIAARIIEEHKGVLNLRSRPGRGATFTITLPCREERAWVRS